MTVAIAGYLEPWCGYQISYGWGWLDVADTPAPCPAAVHEELEFLWVELRDDEMASSAKRIHDDAQLMGGEAAPQGWGRLRGPRRRR